MKSAFIQIPCRRFTLRVVLGPHDGLGEFEQVALRAIAASADTVEKLSDTLRIDPRIVLDVCVELLRSGLVLIDASTGRIELTARVRDAMGNPSLPTVGWAERVSGAKPPETREYPMFQELVGGGVMPTTRDARGIPAPLRAPENDALPHVREIQKPHLMNAVAKAVRKRLQQDVVSTSESTRSLAQGTARQRVVDIQFPTGSGGPEGDAARDTLIVEVARHGQDNSEPPDLRIVGPRGLSRSIRHGIAHGLTAMWERGIARNEDQFFGRLLRTLEAADLDVDVDSLGDPHRSLATLLHHIEGAARIDPTDPTLRDVHAEIESLEQRAREEVDEAATNSSRPRLVEGTANQHALVYEALKTAKDQVVLTSPWMRRLDTDDHLATALTDAVDRGVRVHLLWGIDRNARFDDTFGPRARELIAELAAPKKQLGRMFVADRPSAVHAKLVICDFDWMLVSTSNILNNSPDRRELELGVVVEGPPAPDVATHPGEGRPPVARSLRTALRWTKSILPDFRLQNTLVDDPILGGRRSLAPPLDLDIDLRAPNASALERDLWVAGWKQRHQRLGRKLANAGTIVQAIADAQHRRTLFDAIQNAEKRLYIASPDLASAVLAPALLPHLRAAIERGVDVTFLYRSEDAEAVGSRRRELEDLGARFLTRDIHAKALVCDGWCLISSFNFLSFTGYYDAERRARHEFGVRILDLDFSDAVAVALMAAPLR